MFFLPLRERLFVATLLLAVVLGVAVKHWRDARREARAQFVAALPSADPGSVAKVSSHPQP